MAYPMVNEKPIPIQNLNANMQRKQLLEDSLKKYWVFEATGGTA
jgi:hypothetical protein